MTTHHVLANRWSSTEIHVQHASQQTPVETQSGIHLDLGFIAKYPPHPARRPAKSVNEAEPRIWWNLCRATEEYEAHSLLPCCSLQAEKPRPRNSSFLGHGSFHLFFLGPCLQQSPAYHQFHGWTMSTEKAQKNQYSMDAGCAFTSAFASAFCSVGTNWKLPIW